MMKMKTLRHPHQPPPRLTDARLMNAAAEAVGAAPRPWIDVAVLHAVVKAELEHSGKPKIPVGTAAVESQHQPVKSRVARV